MRKLLLRYFRVPGSARLWLALAFACALLAGFLEITDEVLETPADAGGIHAFDNQILDRIAQHRTPVMTKVMTDLTSLGSVSVVLVLSAIVVTLLVGLGDRLGLAHLGVILLGAGFWPYFLKGIFGRDRPAGEHLVEVTNLSFPSGHAFGATAVYTTLAFFAVRHLRDRGLDVFFYLLAAIIVGLIAFSRMYLGVHFPSDVAAGICAGGFWSFLVAGLFIPTYRKHQAAERKSSS